MAVKRPTLLKTIDADFDYTGGAYTGIPMQVVIDSDRIDEDWINDMKIIPKPISKSSHDDKEVKTLVHNLKRITRTFRIHGNITNTSTAGTHTAVAESATILTDSTKDFLAVGIGIGMTISNTTDGSTGVITTVAATTLTCSGGISGGSDNKFQKNDVYTITQTAHVKANLLRRMLWDGNAGSTATLSIPGSDSEQPPSQNIEGFVKGLHVTINEPMTYAELDALNENINVVEVTVDFIVGDEM